MQDPLYNALLELDQTLQKKGIEPFDLYVVGGFAMLLNGVRETCTPDIDYIGPTLPETIKNAMSEIGEKYGFEEDWINNELLIPGGNIKDIEACTGTLHFTPPRPEFSVIRISTLCNEDLLRMKMIAIDTSYTGHKCVGATFTRHKDFADVERLMKNLNMSFRDVVTNTKDYVIEPDIYYLLNYYLKTHDKIIVNGTKEDKIIDMYKARLETRKAAL